MRFFANRPRIETLPKPCKHCKMLGKSGLVFESEAHVRCGG
jgi:hypothetical protein